MGRGLSEQQQDILRTALAVNAEINQGTAQCRISTADCEQGSFRVTREREPPDMMPEIAYVLVLRLAYHGYNTINGRPGGLCEFVAPTRVTTSQKVSLHKAFHRLVARGMLTQYGLSLSNSCHIYGYLLTQQGIDVAAKLPPFECANIADAVDVFRRVADGAVVDWRRTHENQVFMASFGSVGI